MSRYRKVEVRCWQDPAFCGLSDRGRLLWLYLLTGPRTLPIPGVVVARPAVMADDLRWPPEAFREAFREAFAKPWAKVDEGAGLAYLRRALLTSSGRPRDTNRPESPNVLRSWGGVWADIPDCPLKLLILRDIEAFAKGLGEAFARAFREAFPEALAKPSGNQEQEQEQEQETGTGEGESAREARPTPNGPTGGNSSKRTCAKDRLLARWGDAARELWQRQEELRKGCIRGARSLEPTAERLARVAAVLEAGNSAEDCRAVLERIAADVRRDPGQARWFNGETNWRPANFDRALGSIGAPAAGNPARGRVAGSPDFRPQGGRVKAADLVDGLLAEIAELEAQEIFGNGAARDHEPPHAASVLDAEEVP